MCRMWLFKSFDFGKAELHDVTVSTNGWHLEASRAVRTNGVWTFYNVREWIRANGTWAPTVDLDALTIREFDETPREIRIELRIANYERLARRKTDVPLMDILQYIRLRPGNKSAWLLTQLHERLAAPWTCLVVVLIAVPFGAASGRRNLFFGVAGSIFICFAYFVVQQFSLALGIGNHLPGWLAAWLPNLFFGVTGAVLMMRVK